MKQQNEPDIVSYSIPQELRTLMSFFNERLSEDSLMILPDSIALAVFIGLPYLMQMLAFF